MRATTVCPQGAHQAGQAPVCPGQPHSCSSRELCIAGPSLVLCSQPVEHVIFGAEHQILRANPSHTARKSQKNRGRSSELSDGRARARCALSSRLSKLAARPSAYLRRREQNCACSTRSHSQPGPTPPARISCWRRRGLLHMWPALRSRRWWAAMLFCIEINSFAAKHACHRVG